MILRRITQHVRDQNWTAIGIDLVIVVVGVFVGLQVNTWNEARVQAATEQATLVRLAEEFGAVEEELARAADNYVSTVQSTGVVIEALRAGTPPDNEAAFREHLARAGFVWGIPTQSTTYSEMVSTGAISHLSDADLRAALTRYGDYAARYARTHPGALAVLLDPASNYLQAVQWSTDPDDWGAASTAVVGFDWDRLLGSKGEMQSWQGYQSSLSGYTRNQLDEVQAILANLKASP
ncbi:hypothetical protein [Rubrivirga sp. IMCC43871]|uniref:hypothetical protein n=1 Tax=Rubrivirga sp. IMCC43871 TaxID=3391575 RepID=UPI003990236C